MSNTAKTIPVDSFFAPIVDANTILSALSENDYNASPSGPFSSTIGEHFRHILDHYHALMLGFEAAHVDYNQRSRHSRVEKEKDLASAQWQQVADWLNGLGADDYNKSLKVITEHNEVMSTVGRELSFVSSHAVHHFAFIKQLAAFFSISLPKDVGVAPATLKSQHN